MTRSRRGQMEMMGLVIIMVLVSLGILFMIQFSLSKASATPRAVFTQAEIAKNTLNSLLKTSVACPTFDAGVDMTSLVQDCAGGRELDCNRDGVPDACNTAQAVFDQILNSTVNVWAKNYQLEVYAGSVSLMSIEQGACPGTKSSGLYYVPPKHGGTEKLFVQLDVCERSTT